MPELLERSTRLVLDLLFPPRCALCGAGETLLCDACTEALPPADGRRCASCWMPVAGGTVCGHCRAAPPSYAAIRSAYIMEEGVRRLAHELKYEGLTALAEPMAALMLPVVDAAPVDLVSPVPLHPRRERARGYNQSAALAKQLAGLLGLPYEARAVRRVRDTAPLAKTMHRDERRAIVAGAFAGDAACVDSRRLLLIDDVVTTGATLDACASALLAAGARSVRCVTWARAD